MKYSIWRRGLASQIDPFFAAALRSALITYTMKPRSVIFILALFACLYTAMAAPKAPPAPMSTQAKFENVMAYLTYVLLGLSIAGATFTIITFMIFSRIRTYPIKLICWLCLTIAIGHLLFVIVSFTAKGTPWCEPAAALIHFWFMANFCWVCTQSLAFSPTFSDLILTPSISPQQCFCLSYNFYQLVR